MLRPTVKDYQATEKRQYKSENTKLFFVLSLSDSSYRSIFCISKVVISADKINRFVIVVNIVNIYLKCGCLALQVKTL